MQIVFVGESWKGSSARSLREALAARGVEICEIDESHFLPKHRSIPLRAANRLCGPLRRTALERAIRRAVAAFRPDAVVIYKGAGIRPRFVSELQALGYPIITIFPDYSPHVYGERLHESVGRADLVISTKPFHPPLWRAVYGYRNSCVCVPHGYDPGIHLWLDPAFRPQHDVALCATWRLEYHQLMCAFADATKDADITVTVAGNGWVEHRSDLPRKWQVSSSKVGRAYTEFLRSAKIAIAPVTRSVVVHGINQPGDEDSTRTYELAAAHCFFLHQRTEYVKTVFDEHNEVPLWSDAKELASLVLRWLPDESGRRALAAAAHARAVPAYSIPQRAAEIMKHLAHVVDARSVEQCTHD